MRTARGLTAPLCPRLISKGSSESLGEKSLFRHGAVRTWDLTCATSVHASSTAALVALPHIGFTAKAIEE